MGAAAAAGFRVSGEAKHPVDPNEAPGQTAALPLDELLRLAEDEVHLGGALLLQWFHHGFEGEIASKSTPTDLVSQADIEVERKIREGLERMRPQDGFLGEESGERMGSSGLTWVVDPLDGTVNYLFGLPHWCVSVAVRDGDGVLAGAIYDPLRGELFTATRGGPAILEAPKQRSLLGPKPREDAREYHTLSGGECNDLSTAMVATGLAYDAGVRAAQGEVLARVIPRVRDIRRFGSAALDLAWTAAGRYDAYFERTVKPWDIAAGVLVCERAGLVVRELPEREGLPFGVMVASAGIADQLGALVS